MIDNYRYFAKRANFFKFFFELLIFINIYFFTCIQSKSLQIIEIFLPLDIGGKQFDHFFPSLCCIAFDEVVNSNLNFSFGLALLKHSTEANATSWKPDRINFNLPDNYIYRL